MSLPNFSELFIPVLDAIRVGKGRASNSEILKYLQQEGFETGPMRDGNRSELEYRAAWARSYLKAFGALENPERGLWSIGAKAGEVTPENARNIVNHVVSNAKKNYRRKKSEPSDLPRAKPRLARVESKPSIIDQVRTILSLVDNGFLSKSSAEKALVLLFEEASHD